jgi:hypothetical protein
MTEDILINVTPFETRVALVAQGAVQELHLERSIQRGQVSNIYLGKVVRVLPGMQSAFVEIGLGRAAFIHIADLRENRSERALGVTPTPIEKLIFEGQMKLYESVAYFENNKTVKAKSNTYINNNWNVFEGWSCDIGIDNVYIHWNGEIKGACQQTIYGLDYAFNILDTQFVEKFNPEFRPAICTKKNCFCSPETHVSKFRLS